MSLKIVIYRILANALNIFEADVIHFTKPWRAEIFSFIKSLKKERNFLMSYLDAYNLASLTITTNDISGDIAEIGSYQGASAKLIGKYKTTGKSLFVIDSFQGLPEVLDIDRQAGFKKGAYKANKSDVDLYLEHIPNVAVISGFFPQENSELLNDREFSLVHLDIDLYEPTKDCLEFFYSRMTQGGVILSHDYHTPGIRRAFTEFLADKPEIAIELIEHHGMIVKL